MAVARIIVSLVFLLYVPLSLAGGTLAVIYPNVQPPDDQIFKQILAGIKTQNSTNLLTKSIADDEAPEVSVNWVTQKKPDMLITLGKRGFRIAKRLNHNIPLVVGALPIRPSIASGISLLADPKTQFNHLKTLAPNITSIHVVYNAGNRWLIEIASQHAEKIGLQLNGIEVKNVKDAVASYNDLLQRMDHLSEAIWLLEDAITAHEQVIIPNILEKSWEQKLVIFSGIPELAKRGALFSVIPDHQSLGQNLVKMAKEVYDTDKAMGVVPLKSLKLAVNLRTAAHLGYRYSDQQIDLLPLTFPE